MNLTVTAGGTGALAYCKIKPFLRENQHARSFFVCIYTSDNHRIVWRETALNSTHLIALVSTGNFYAAAGVKDEYDVWSPLVKSSVVSMVNFAGASVQASIASATVDERLLEAPSLRFPRFAFGSSQMEVWRTLVSDGFYDEQRKLGTPRPRAAFTCKLTLLEEEDVRTLNKFVRSLNGPLSPFIFEWFDPRDLSKKEYTVRFKNAEMTDSLTDVNYYDTTFSLVELASATVGGEL